MKYSVSLKFNYIGQIATIERANYIFSASYTRLVFDSRDVPETYLEYSLISNLEILKNFFEGL